MANTVRYGCTSLLGTNKTGLLRPDGNGYYPMVVGALKMLNSAGEFYDYEQGKQVFDASGQFQRRIERGVVKAEYGHPKKELGMKNHEFASRVLHIDERMVCAHFRDVWLDPQSVKDKSGQSVVAVMASVRPSGPYGGYLKDSIDNKDENVCFSIRAFTEDKMVNGINNRVLKQVITFDYVTEPGMAAAEKYKSPALESFDDTILTRGEFEVAMREEAELGVAMESADLAINLFQAMGWNLPKGVTPIYTRW